MDSLQVLFWATLGSVISLVGGMVLLRATRLRQQVIVYALPFGAGTLLATAFVSTLPEALEDREPSEILMWALSGFLLFFALERLVGWFHHHHHDDVHGGRDRVHTYLVVIGDTLHNAIDGIAIGAAFLVNPAAGITMSIAVAAHEIPQEIGDFGLMLHKGLSRGKTLLVNALSALATTVFAVITFALGSANALPMGVLIGISAGFLLYIAMSDIMPELHKHDRGRRLLDWQPVLLVFGVVVVVVAVQIAHTIIH